MTSDITLSSETTMLDNLAVFKLAVESSSNHIIITDLNGLIIYANEAAQETTGFPFAEMEGNTPRLWGGQMSPDYYQKLWSRIKVERQPFVGEIKNIRKNGQVYTSFARISPIVSEDGNLVGFIGTEEDITERVELEMSLKDQASSLAQKTEQNEAILLSIGDAVVVVDVRDRILLINPAALEMLGYEEKDVLGKEYLEVVRPRDESGVLLTSERCAALRAKTAGQKITTVIPYTRANDSIFVASTINSPMVIDGTLYGTVIAFRDITAEKEIDKAKTEFISLASHQLRTPLSAINWYVEMLLAGDAGEISAEQKKFLEEAYTGSQRMVKLVNALLNVSRIESNTYMVNPEPVDVIRILRSVMDEMKLRIDEKSLHLVLNKEEIPTISLDPSLMTIIFQNLLTNAVKYTDDEGTITIDLQLLDPGETIAGKTISEKSLLVQFTDTGIGIPPAEQDKIFTKLFRANNVQKTDAEGTGLGLYLIKGLIEKGNGKLWFESQENVGSTFYVLLPTTGMVKKEGSKKLDL